MPGLTEHDQIDSLQRRIRELEATVRALVAKDRSADAQRLANDFNNLLPVILGYGQFALEGLPEDAPIRDELRQVLHAGERATALTRQLLTQPHAKQVRPSAIDLGAELGRAQRVLRPLLGDDIAVSVESSSGLWPVGIDADHLEQILINLACNARDAMPRGGTLFLGAHNLLLERLSEPSGGTAPALRGGATFDGTAPALRGGATFDGTAPALRGGATFEASVDIDLACDARDAAGARAFVVLRVSDTGVGLSQDVRRRLSEPLLATQVDRTRGTGLAATLCIVHAAGGYVTVDSAPGVGTTFHIHLPRVADAAPAPAPTAEAEPLRGGAETVLLVEDEPRVRKLAHRVLASHGYNVLCARDGNEALEVSRAHQGAIQLLLTDLIMPQMGGEALAKHFLERRPDARVLYMTGYSPQMADVAGPAWLQKPLRAAELLIAVRSVLDG